MRALLVYYLEDGKFYANSLRYLRRMNSKKLKNTSKMLNQYYIEPEKALSLFDGDEIKSFDNLGNRNNMKIGSYASSKRVYLADRILLHTGEVSSDNKSIYRFNTNGIQDSTSYYDLILLYHNGEWKFTTIAIFIKLIDSENSSSSRVGIGPEESPIDDIEAPKESDLRLKPFTITSTLNISNCKQVENVSRLESSFVLKYGYAKYVKISLSFLLGNNNENSVAIVYETLRNYTDDDVKFITRAAKACKIILNYEINRGRISDEYSKVFGDIQQIMSAAMHSFTSN